MPQAILFDLFETLITESDGRPAGVSSLAPEFGCERAAFRREWKALRPAVTIGRVTFRQALADIAARLGSPVEDVMLQRVCERRKKTKAEPLARLEAPIVRMIDDLRRRDLRLGVISNCLAEDVASWPHSPLALRFDATVFSFEAGVAKPNPAIYLEAVRRLGVDASQSWYIGDGADDECAGAARAGLTAFRALWFLRRWPHFQEEPCAVPTVNAVHECIRLVDEAIGE